MFQTFTMAREFTTHDEIVLPLHAEEIAVCKERMVTGKVRVSIVTQEGAKAVNELLVREAVEIERRPIGKQVERAPAVRRSGDTIIIPVMEEALVVTRRLIVKEEIRVRLVKKRERHKQLVTVRKQKAMVQRLPAATRGPPQSNSRVPRDQPINRDPEHR